MDSRRPANAANPRCRAPVIHLAVQVTDRAGREHQHQFMLQAARNAANCRCVHPPHSLARGPSRAPQVVRFATRRVVPSVQERRAHRQRLRNSTYQRALALARMRRRRDALIRRITAGNDPLMREAFTQLRTAFASARARAPAPLPLMTCRSQSQRFASRPRRYRPRPPHPYQPAAFAVPTQSRRPKSPRHAAQEANRRIRDQLREEEEKAPSCSCAPGKRDTFAL